MKREIYFDNSATTPLHPEVAEKIYQAMLGNFGNPSSLHQRGIMAEQAVTSARKSLAHLLQVMPEEICFNSGGTESNNQAIKGIAQAHKNRGRQIITSRQEHPSVLHVCQRLAAEGFRVDYLPVRKNGIIDLADLEALLCEETILVSLMHVNNEVGGVQPVAEVGRLLAARKKKIYFHVDAVQSFGKLAIHPGQWGIDLLSLSGHKIHGPKGIGALYVRKGTRLQALMEGGGQERDLRSGTENVPGIIGLAKAAEIAVCDLAAHGQKMTAIKEALVLNIKNQVAGCRVNSNFGPSGAPHILNISFPGTQSEVLLHYLEQDGIYVSSGSACSAKNGKPSHVLTAMGLSEQEKNGAIRFSFSYMNELSEVLPAAESLVRAVNELRELQGGRQCTN